MMATVVDCSGMSMYHHGYPANGTIDNHHHSPPPPLPVRLHHARDPRPATALGHGDLDPSGGYLAPVAVRPEVDDGPPLPPRQPLRQPLGQPLRRSVSLTQRAPPEPGTDNGLRDDRGQTGVDMVLPGGHEPTLDEVLASLRRSRVDSTRPAPLSPALSAPLLGQVSLIL